MAGFEMMKSRIELGVPDEYRIEAAIAIGRKGDAKRLPEKLQARETPSTRHPLDDIAYPGNFRARSTT